MYQISNVDEGKSEWNLNETHIIIPMIEGDVIGKESDKILTNSLTLNPLEAGDALEHSFVIGLDKNLFESPGYKSDLVIIQNSDLKLLSCSNDLKNPVAYALSYVDQDKNDILWHAPEQKDKIYPNDRDELDDLGKNKQINLVIETDIETKTDDVVLQDENTETGSLLYVDTTKPETKPESLQTVNLLEENITNKPVQYLKCKTDNKDIIKTKTTKGVSNSLPEKSLPLKKKAKMKRTLPSYSENHRSLLKQDSVRKLGSNLQGDNKQNDATKRRKTKTIQQDECPSINSEKFSSIFDLVECLRKCRMINASIYQTLNSGLKEMDVDILKEMNEKKLSESRNYSPQLKAFALVLYFKQPAAFNYLSQVYEAGWPSLKTIKDWKRRVNSHQRPKS